MFSMLAARPGRDQHHLGPQLRGVLALGPDVEAHALVVDRDRLGVEPGVRHHGDPALGEAPLDDAADLRVLERDDVRQVLEQRDLDADVMEHRRELDADGAGTHDHDVLRERVEPEDLVAGHDPLAVDLETGQRLDPRAGGEDHVRRVEHPLPAPARRAILTGLIDADLARAIEPAAALDPGHLVLRDERLQPGPQALDDRVAPGCHRRVVDLRLTGEDESRAPWRCGPDP